MAALLQDPIVCPVLIGRAAALESLNQLIGQARGGHGRTTLISGEAGVGKSRLVAEVKTRPPPDAVLPYAPLLDLLGAFCTSRAPDAVARYLGPSAPGLAKLLPEFATCVPDLASGQALDAEQEQCRLFESLSQFIFRLAALAGDPKASPLLIVVEDLHWSDDSSLEFLLHLARRVAADAKRLTASAAEHADLFWDVRGGRRKFRPRHLASSEPARNAIAHAYASRAGAPREFPRLPPSPC